MHLTKIIDPMTFLGLPSILANDERPPLPLSFAPEIDQRK